MTKHELILSIQGKQSVNNSTVLPYDVLLAFDDSVLEDMHINLSSPNCLIDFDTATKLIESIRTTGGATYSPSSKVINPVSGYMVGLLGYEKQVKQVWNTIDLKHVLNYWLTETGMNADVKVWEQWNAFIGLWESNGTLYIDISQNIAEQKIAVSLGQSRKQICIWDCANKVEIKTS